VVSANSSANSTDCEPTSDETHVQQPAVARTMLAAPAPTAAAANPATTQAATHAPATLPGKPSAQAERTAAAAPADITLRRGG